jgi:S-disulfanyl-L-cysteine oxidoreductase SoxD
MRLGKAVAAVILCGLMGALVAAQSYRSVMEGVYTEEQAKRGREIYGDQCRLCHGRDLEGTYESHALVGDEFTSDWEGQDIFSLYERIRITMSAGASGRDGPAPPPLTRAQTADLVAFLLWFNRVPAGKAELSSNPEVLKQLRFETPAP